MAKALINDEYLSDIADAIRAKTGDSALMYPAEMADKIMDIPTSGDYQTKTATPSTSQQVILPDPQYDALSQVTVEAALLQEKNVVLSDSAQQIVADSGYYGLSLVNVPAAPTFVTQSKTVHPSTSQQTVLPDAGKDGLSSVVVEAMNLENRQVTPSTSVQVITPTSGNDGISQVTVDAINLQTKQVTPSGVAQIITADQNYDGLLQVQIAAVPQNPDMDLLWSWTSAFDQDHTVSVDLTGYGGVLIYGEVNSNSGTNPVPSRYKCLTYVPVTHGGTTSRSVLYGGYVDSSSSIQGYRSVNVTDAGLVFGDGHSVTGRTDSVNNNYARPIRIYGVKETCPLFYE